MRTFLINYPKISYNILDNYPILTFERTNMEISEDFMKERGITDVENNLEFQVECINKLSLHKDKTCVWLCEKVKHMYSFKEVKE
jgi:hypothetical protein